MTSPAHVEPPPCSVRQTVFAKVDGHTVALAAAPDVLDLLIPHLQYTHRQWHVEDEGMVSSHVTELYCSVSEDGVLHTRWGMLPLIRTILTSQGCQLEQGGRFCFPAFGLVDAAMRSDSELDQVDRDFINTVENRPGGVIDVSHEWEMAQRIALLATLYWRASIFVVAHNKDAAKRLISQVQGLTNRPAVFATKIDWKQKGQFVVGWPHYIGSLNPDDWDIVIFADSRDAASQEAFKYVPRLRDQLLFTFQFQSQQLDQHQQMRLLFLVGPYLAGGNAAKTGTAVTIGAPGLAAEAQDGLKRVRSLKRPDEALQRKRICIWQNDTRNQFVADLAVACTDRDESSLQRFGISDSAVLEAVAASSDVAVLVESAEHARELHRLLPDWELVTAVPVAPDVEGQFSWSNQSKRIVTMVFADRVGLTADVLLRADGTGTGWHKEWNTESASQDTNTEQVVVDIVDAFDSQAIAEAQARREEYSRLGWLKPNTTSQMKSNG